MRRPVSLLCLSLVTTLWSVALVAAPSADAPRFSTFVYAAGSMVCHQRPERSFHRQSAQYPVCARCLGLYLGAAVGVFAWVGIAGARTRPRTRIARMPSASWRRLLIVVGAPTMITVLTATAGWWDASNALRAGLAVPLGAAIAALVAAVAAGDLR